MQKYNFLPAKASQILRLPFLGTQLRQKNCLQHDAKLVLKNTKKIGMMVMIKVDESAFAYTSANNMIGDGKNSNLRRIQLFIFKL